MGLKRLIENKIRMLVENTAILRDPSASFEKRGAALIAVFGNDPEVQKAVGQIAFRKEKSVETKPVATTVISLPKPAPQPSVVPARKLDTEKSPEQRRDLWFKILGGFLSGRKIDPIKTSRMTTSVFLSGVELTLEHWQFFFNAMKKAAECGFFILHNDANPAEVFMTAPIDLLDEYVFGKDGAMVSVLANLSELNGGSRMPGWLVAKAYVLANAVSALDSRYADGIGEQEMSWVGKLQAAIEAIDGPENLIGQIRAVTNSSDSPTEKLSRCRGAQELLQIRENLPASQIQVQ